MKVCFFNTMVPWGGGENWHLSTAHTLQVNGYDVTIVADKDSVLSQRAKAQGIKVNHFTLKKNSFLNIRKHILLYNYFREEKFDVVILNSPKELKMAINVAVWAKIKRIIYRRGSAIPIRNTFFNRWMFKKLTDIIANSETTKKTILQNNPNIFPADKIAVIYNVIDMSAFVCEQTTKNSIPIIGNLGRCMYQKGQDMLLEIAYKLKQRGVICKFIIGGEGLLLDNLKAQAKKLDIIDMVDFVGFVENTNDFLRNIDIFALTSRWEGFGYVIAEAMASSKPVVAFDISSNSELVLNDETGILVPFNDLDLFADAIEKLIKDTFLQETFGKIGKEIVNEKFSIEQNGNKIIEFLRKG